MKITRLDIYGFGKHENKIIEFGENVNVVFGQNEAGKTTIQQFILQILFGFPQKNSTLLRYEPKSGGKYGGRIHINDCVYGECIIERVRGKSAGEVTVYFNDGTQGGEEELSDLIRHYDRTSFESVFSFSVLQLQGFERMDENELSRTLLASGTTGVDTLLQVEKKMEKEAGDLFKKTGRVPAMNVLLQQLKEMEDDLKKEQHRLADYAPKMKRIDEIEQRLARLKKHYDERKDENQNLSLQLQSLPLTLRKKTLLDNLTIVKNEHFPSDGIKRYETVRSKWTETDVRLRGVDEEIVFMRERLEQALDLTTLAEMQRLLALEPEWHKWHADLKAVRDNMEQLHAKKMRLLDRLGVKETDRIVTADVSIHKEEQLYEGTQKIAELDRQLEYVDRQLIALEQEQQGLQSEHNDLQQTAPSEANQKRVEQWPEMRGKLAEARAYVAMRQQDSTDGNRMIMLLLMIAAIASAVVGFIEKQWFGIFVGLLIALGAVLMIVGKRRQSPDDKRKKMMQIIENVGGQEGQMEQLVEEVNDFKSSQLRLEQLIASNERKMTQLGSEYEAFSREREALENNLLHFFISYGLDKIPNAGILHEFFSMARSVQEAEREIMQAMKKQDILTNDISERTAELKARVTSEIAVDQLYEELRKTYVELRTAEQENERLSNRLDELKKEKSHLHELTVAYKKQVDELFNEARVANENEFYDAQRNFEKTQALTQQLLDVESQLAHFGNLKVRSDVPEQVLKSDLAATQEQMNELEHELEQLIDEKATLKAETDKLLSDDTYQSKQQFFEMKKAEFNEMAHQWSIRQAIVQAIKGMMKELKDTKLPEVLVQAENLFATLTDGLYTAMEITETGLFRAVASDGTRYPIIELSQATKEQAYISLRLSLAMAMESTAPFPILMDDPFVHFDKERLSRMISIVNQLSEKHQFIYTTCHDKIKEEWTTATIINVSEIGNDKGAIAT